MRTPQVQAELVIVARPAGTNEHREIANRIVQLQTRITSDRRYLAALQASTVLQSEDRAERLAYLHNDIAQHEFEMYYWISRLELLQPGH